MQPAWWRDRARKDQSWLWHAMRSRSGRRPDPPRTTRPWPSQRSHHRATLGKERLAVELQQPFLDDAPHRVRDVGHVDTVAKAALEAVAVEHGQEELEVLLLAAVRRCRHQQEVRVRPERSYRSSGVVAFLDAGPATAECRRARSAASVAVSCVPRVVCGSQPVGGVGVRAADGVGHWVIASIGIVNSSILLLDRQAVLLPWGSVRPTRAVE